MSAASGSLAVEEWKARDKTRGRKRRREREGKRISPHTRQSHPPPGNVRARALFVLVREGGQTRARGGVCEMRERGCGCRRRSGGREDVEHEPAAVAAGEKMLRVHGEEAG